MFPEVTPDTETDTSTKLCFALVFGANRLPLRGIPGIFSFSGCTCPWCGGLFTDWQKPRTYLAASTPFPKSATLVQHNQQDFLRLVTMYQSQLYGYLHAMLHNMADTEDVLQNTIVVLWKKFDQFEPGTNFLHWAMRTARFEALKFQRAWRRDRRFFSEAFVDALSEGPFGTATESIVERRQSALAGCMQKLEDRDRRLLDNCYKSGSTIAAVAAQYGRSAQSICNSLRRIRQMLFACVERTLARGEENS